MIMLFNSQFVPTLVFPNMKQEQQILDIDGDKAIKVVIRIKSENDKYSKEELQQTVAKVRYLLNKETEKTYKVQLSTIAHKDVYTDISLILKQLTVEDELNILDTISNERG